MTHSALPPQAKSLLLQNGKQIAEMTKLGPIVHSTLLWEAQSFDTEFETYSRSVHQSAEILTGIGTALNATLFKRPNLRQIKS